MLNYEQMRDYLQNLHVEIEIAKLNNLSVEEFANNLDTEEVLSQIQIMRGQIRSYPQSELLALKEMLVMVTEPIKNYSDEITIILRDDVNSLASNSKIDVEYALKFLELGKVKFQSCMDEVFAEIDSLIEVESSQPESQLLS